MSNLVKTRVPELFKSTVLFSKLFFIGLCIILGVINNETDYVKANPGKFYRDALSLGFFSGLAFFIIGFVFRGASFSTAAEHFFFAFLIFFMFSVAREYAGYFNYMSGDLDKTQKTVKKVLRWPMMVIVGGIGLAVVLMALLRHDGKIDYSRSSLMRGFADNKFSGFAIETLIVSAVFSVGDFIVALNHGEKGGHLIKSTGANFIMIVFAHIMFQMGGLYTVLYPPTQAFNFRME
jgi:hypothetical protein